MTADIAALREHHNVPRLTPLRQRVLNIVSKAAHPVTAYEILDLLRPQDASATPAGVYRSLDFLTRNGLAHRLETTKAFVACVLPHHGHENHCMGSQFLVCRTCGIAIEAQDSGLAAAVAALAQRHGFHVSDGTVEMSGLCPACHIK